MWTNVLLAFVGLFAYMYWALTRKFGYFKSRGVFEAPSYFPFGSVPSFKFFTGRLAFMRMMDGYYKDYPNEKLVGNFSLGKPQLCVNDLEYAKLVMIKDFDHFIDRRTIELGDSTEMQKLVNRMLTTLKGDKWKLIRSKLSPAFTSGKLKQMLHLIHRVGDDFNAHLGVLADKDEEFLAKEVLTSYTLDSIATCGFGVEMNTFKNPDSIFVQMANKIVRGSAGAKGMVKIMFILIFPSIAKALNMTFIDEQASSFFVDMIKKAMAQRKASGQHRSDFIDLVFEALKDNRKEKVVEDDQFEKDAQVKADHDAVLSEEEMERCLLANAMILFLAGFDTSSTTMAVLLTYLANYQDVQERLYEEIAEAVDNNDGNPHLDYNTIQGLPYLDQTIHETLRIHPLTIIERVCTKDYQFPGSSFVVPKGMLVQVPSTAIMNSHEFFPNPEQFDPDNFSPDNKAGRTPYAFLGFGQGPRNCIGMRFALLNIKVALVRLLYDFKVVRGPKTPVNIEHDPLSQSAQPIGGTWVKVERRN